MRRQGSAVTRPSPHMAWEGGVSNTTGGLFLKVVAYCVFIRTTPKEAASKEGKYRERVCVNLCVGGW